MDQEKLSTAATAKVPKDRYKLCPSCGNFARVEELQTFCMVCGNRMIHECPECHEPIIYPTARFCPVCGVMLVRLVPKAGGLA